MKRKKILFCHTGLSTFVKSDLEILSKEYEVIPYYYRLGTTPMMKIINIFSSFLFALKWVWKVDVVFCWFGGYHGFFPVLLSKIFKKKSIIVVGGYDAAYVPSISYGIFYTGGFQLWCVKMIYKWATWICPVDESLVKSTNYYADPCGVGYKTGILNFIPLVQSKMVVLPTGYVEPKMPRSDLKKSGILSIAMIQNDKDFYLKGLDIVIDLANKLGQYSFTFVGIDPYYFKTIESKIPENLQIMFPLDNNSLMEVYMNHKIYLQISMSEGLPNSLCEAMLFGCIPIGSNVNGIPKAIGNTGFILYEKKIQTLIGYVVEAMELDDKQGQKARERILEMFPLEKRVSSLLSIINC